MQLPLWRTTVLPVLSKWAVEGNSNFSVNKLFPLEYTMSFISVHTIHLPDNIIVINFCNVFCGLMASEFKFFLHGCMCVKRQGHIGWICIAKIRHQISCLLWYRTANEWHFRITVQPNNLVFHKTHLALSPPIGYFNPRSRINKLGYTLQHNFLWPFWPSNQLGWTQNTPCSASLMASDVSLPVKVSKATMELSKGGRRWIWKGIRKINQ